MRPDNNLLNDENKPFHSNSFAQIASGNRIGTTSNSSFNKRQVIESSRRIVGGYKYSRLGTLRGLSKTNQQNISSTNSLIAYPKPSLQKFNSVGMPTSSKPQKYDPYA